MPAPFSSLLSARLRQIHQRMLSTSPLIDRASCVIDDMPAIVHPDSPHSAGLLEQGYRSSFTTARTSSGWHALHT